MTSRVLAAGCALALAGAASAQKIGIYGAQDCTTSFVCAPTGVPTQVFVMADQHEQPSWSKGLGGAEFRVSGIPSAWMATATPAPNVLIAIGDPIGPGCNVALYPMPTADCALLYTLTLVPTSEVEDAVLGIATHTSPSRPGFACPWLFYPCNFPGPSASACVVPPICAEAVELHVRSMPDCAIAVEPTSWGTVKQLFR